MKLSELLMPSFAHIYVESEAFDNPRTENIIAKFPNAHVIKIGHYKDVFNRRRQNADIQHMAMNLIIAEKHGQLVYKGAPVCQSFGNEHFYYTSCIMNCVFDCEYCYLKGMYPSGNLVIFVNLEDYFREIEEYLEHFPVYLCVSYDTDLVAFEGIAGFLREWFAFAAAHNNLTIEVRTKSGNTGIFKSCGGKTEENRNCGEGEYDKKTAAGLSECLADAKKRMIFAYTISPDEIIRAFEHGSADFHGRLRAAHYAAEAGFPVRLCFDPMIYVPGWKNVYRNMFNEISSELELARVRDFGIGTFRISESYLKNLRHVLPNSAAVQYPFELQNGYYQYPQSLARQMENFAEDEILRRVPDAEIFRWEEGLNNRARA